jgi:hypothetical protein
MFGSKKAGDVSLRETRKMFKLTERSDEAFAKGDISKAVRLGGQAAAIHKRWHEEYARNHPHSPRYQR